MNLFDLIINDKEPVQLDDVFLDKENQQTIRQLIKEHRFMDQLSAYGLPVNNKIMLHGASGCGKTTAAKAIATALNKPILILNLANVINARIGETSQNMKMIFEKAGRDKAVLFLDEFSEKEWERKWAEFHDKDEKHAFSFTFEHWVRKSE